MDHTPLDPEQIDLIAHETKRAANKALRAHTRRTLAGFLILVGGIGFALHTSSVDSVSSRTAIVQSGRAVAVDSCNGRFQDRAGLRNLLRSAQASIQSELAQGNITPRQALRAEEFYATQLDRLQLPDCRTAASIITDDPGHTVKIPDPYYPAHPDPRLAAYPG